MAFGEKTGPCRSPGLGSASTRRIPPCLEHVRKSLFSEGNLGTTRRTFSEYPFLKTRLNLTKDGYIEVEHKLNPVMGGGGLQKIISEIFFNLIKKKNQNRSN